MTTTGTGPYLSDLTFFFSNIILASTAAGAELWINSANGPPFKYFNRTTSRFYTVPYFCKETHLFRIRWYRKWGPEHLCREYIKDFLSEITVRDVGEAGKVWTNYAHNYGAVYKYVHKAEVRVCFY